MPKNGESMAVVTDATVAPAEISVRLQPNSSPIGRMKTLSDGVSSEKNRKPEKLASTRLQPALHSSAAVAGIGLKFSLPMTVRRNDHISRRQIGKLRAVRGVLPVRPGALRKSARNGIELCMAQLNVSVPEGLKRWAEERVAEGRYASASDLVRDLMRRRQEEEEQLSALQAAIDKGRASGIDPRKPSQIIDDIIREYHEKHG